MFHEAELVAKEYMDNMAPACVYQSDNIIHDAPISNLVSYRRFNDKKYVVCSADISGRLCFSVLTQDNRIELQYKNNQVHFSLIKRIIPLGKSPFVATFAENEPIKIWNTSEKYLSLIINQFKINSDQDFCLCDDSNYTMTINRSGKIECHKLEFTNLSKNVFDQGVTISKKVVQIPPSKFKMVLESPNRIELPYLSLLVSNEDNCSMQVYILHMQTLDILALKVGGGFPLLNQPGLFEVCLVNFKNVYLLEHIDSWQEYYQNVHVIMYDHIKGDMFTLKLGDSGQIEDDQKMIYIGAYSGKPVMHIDLRKGQSPHLMYCADLSLEYLCLSGNYGEIIDGFEDAENIMQYPQHQKLPASSQGSRTNTKKSDSKKDSKSDLGTKKLSSVKTGSSKRSYKNESSKVDSKSKQSVSSAKKSSSKSRSRTSKQTK